MLFLQRVLKDLSQPKAEWNFPTEATERSKKLISYELILWKPQLIMGLERIISV